MRGRNQNEILVDLDLQLLLTEHSMESMGNEQYGKLTPDNFDGLVAILLVSAITYIFMLLDTIKELV